MTVVITGAEGTLGTKLLTAFSHRTVFAYSHEGLDITHEEAVWQVISSCAPSLVINAAALTDPAACEQEGPGPGASRQRDRPVVAGSGVRGRWGNAGPRLGGARSRRCGALGCQRLGPALDRVRPTVTDR